MKLSLFAVIFCALCSGSLTAQRINALALPNTSSNLKNLFYECQVFEIDVKSLQNALSTRSNHHQIQLEAGSYHWNMDLFEHDLFSKNYIRSIGTDQGVERSKQKPSAKTYLGNLKSPQGGNIRLTVAENFIYGFIEEAGVKYFIEPLNGIDPSAEKNQFVIFAENQAKPNPSVTCGYDLYKSVLKTTATEADKTNSNRSHCVEVEIALANDLTVFNARGGVNGAENWCTGILNGVQANYDDEFAHSVEFILSAIFVATTPQNDPWNTVNNINQHLTTHQSWANGGGYGASYDVATAWTRKYTSGAIGLAYVGVICNNARYNVCSDYGAAGNFLRQLQAHELGHNFNSQHDGANSGFIMAPSVNGSNTWSSASISVINAHINSRGCLAPCSSGTPPTANFRATPVGGCIPLTVVFTDLSTGGATTWRWDFPGGTPTTSTAQNPTIIYKSYGTYDVTLRVNNPYGSDEVLFSQFISAFDKPQVSFTQVISDRQVFFNNGTLYGDTFFWTFGDGNSSLDEHPYHEYLDDGTYEVTLKVTNICGVKEIKKTIVIVTPPIVLFEGENLDGCAEHIVKFKNLSSNNTKSLVWEFPGGTPATSMEQNPIVRYKNHGNFDVKLTGVNTKYRATTIKQKYVLVDSIPTSVFVDTLTTGRTVKFYDKSVFGLVQTWYFGDGDSSFDKNPTHTYNKDGQYEVKHIVINTCGADTTIKTIKIGSGLFAHFDPDSKVGCTPFTVSFINKSLNATSYRWTFPGGE
ncbi:MAG: PKD domain-containing protein, partial [Bacteroidota bacterium]|nr:PKD domain-containing protein [Bacteroidota bacterium]